MLQVQSDPGSRLPAMPVRELVDGQEGEAGLVGGGGGTRGRRTGEPYVRLVLGDRTGSLSAVLRDGSGEDVEDCAKGTPVRVCGRFSVHPRYGAQIEVGSLRAARPDEVEYDDLLDGPPRSAELMEADLRELLATIQSPPLRALLDAVFGEGTPTWEHFRVAPAAKRYHQAYRHGLLEHSLTVAQSVSAISATFPGIDRDVAVTGALLHDIGKLDAYTADPLDRKSVV